MVTRKCPLNGFAQCLQDECMAWLANDCRIFASPHMPAFINTPAGPGTEETAQVNALETKENNLAADNAGQDQRDAQATITVLKVTVGKTGNTRAICKVENGSGEQVILAKNSAGEALQKGIGGTFTVKYNLMRDKVAWFAVSARPVPSKSDK